MNYGFGWLRDQPDARDVRFVPHSEITAKLPARVDLSESRFEPSIYDQGSLGSCTANAIAALYEYVAAKERFGKVMPSRLFIYYNEREMEGTAGLDAGAQLRDGLKSVATVGVCKEDAFPYDVREYKTKPPASCYEEAKNSLALRYLRLEAQLRQLKACLASGYPFVFGFAVYSSFMSEATAMTGIGLLPLSGEAIEGGHAVMALGYDHAAGTFLMRNSWGPAWGMNGYFTLPFEYLTDPGLANDFWTIRQVSAAAQIAG